MVRTRIAGALAALAVTAAGLVAGTAGPAAAANLGPYQIRPLHTNDCLDIDVSGGNVSANGLKAQQYDCLGNSQLNQHFYLEPTASAFVYIIHPRSSGKCLDVDNAGTTNGTKIQQWSCNGTPAQKFQLSTPDFGATWTITNPNANRCLDVKGASPLNGTQVQLWTCNNTNAQRWSLIAV
ncbi:hypothetical protein GCM10027589_21160 [Actinocorallia lasiicapitis]